jgi:DNA polymerase-3 subunit gamma/tau
MSYVVLARKWRPQSFADLTGQDHVTRTLTNAIEQDRVPHAILFTGARGVGKTSSARIVAMALNCARGPTPAPCGTCDSCTEIQRGASVDVFEIDGASNRGINEIRELRDGVRFAPSRDRYKIYIVDEVHMLTTEAFNALLKTLEEPPAHVVFLFATTEAHKIPITILSRCQRFDLRRIPVPEIEKRLRQIVDAEAIAIPDDVLSLIARQAGGGMRDALSRLDQVIAFCGDAPTAAAAAEVLGVAERQKLFDLTDALVSRDVERALRVVDHVAEFGVDLGQFAIALAAHLRDLTVAAVAADARDLTALTDGELVQARAQIARTDPATLHRTFEILLAAADDASRSQHARLILEMALVRVVSLEPVQSLAALVAQLDRIAAGTSPLPPAGGAPPTGSGRPAEDPRPVSRGTQASTEPAAPQPAAAEPAAPQPAAAEPAAPQPAAAEPAAPQPAAAEPAAPQPAAAEPAAPQAAATEPAAAEPDPSPPADDDPPARPAVPAQALVPGVPVATTGRASPEQDGSLDTALFRRVIEALRPLNAAAAALLGGGFARARDGATIEVGVPRGLEHRWSDVHQADLETVLFELGAPAWTIALVPRDEEDDGDGDAGYQLVGVEAREREERHEAARQRLLEHEATRLILARWPGTRIGEIEVTDLTEETSG